MVSIYTTWLITALALGVLLMPWVKPKWMKMNADGFVDFIRRYWLHLLLVLSIYNAKDFLDGVDRILLANTNLDMTPWIYAIEGDLVLWVQETFHNQLLTEILTHFYVVGFILICYVSIFYFAYFDDRWMADRSALAMFYIYALAVPFYLFFNVRVTGDYIPGMETLAYDLTPEINDWFSRIDPFTNGMPSLHIGIPFTIWLCLVRFDEDNRWRNYRHLLLGYVILTAFTIIYLGIHWLLDIVGGMALAAIAVSWADKSAKPFWKVFDERTINSRLVTVMTQPSKAFVVMWNKSREVLKSLSKPTSRETGALIVSVLIIVSVVIVWDLTHRELPARGVDNPTQVEAAGGLMVTLDERSDGALLLAHDLADIETPIEIVQPVMDVDSQFDVEDDKLLMANSTTVMVVDLDNPSKAIFNEEISGVTQLGLVQTTSEQTAIALVTGGKLRLLDLDGKDISSPSNASNIELLFVHGTSIAFVTSENPTVVELAKVGTMGTQSLEINASSSVGEDQILEEKWGLNVDMENASIVDVALSYEHIAALVDVNATKRLVLVDLRTANSFIVNDAKYEAKDPFLGEGLLMWASQDHHNPTRPMEEYSDFEIHYLQLKTNLSESLTDDSVEQWGPMVLDDHYLWRQQTDDGQIEVVVLPREASLNTYSSYILQIGVLLSIILCFVFVVQKQEEAKNDNIDSGNNREHSLESE